MPMTSDRETINDLTNRLHESQAELAKATRALGEKEIELRVAREELAMQKELTTMAGREAQRLRNANTELQRQIANATPLGTYLIRNPGVYVVTPSQRSAAGLDVYRHALEDAVVLTAKPDEEPASWWQLYRDGINGELTAWHPPEYLHNAIVRTAMAMRDPSEKPWVGVDKGKPHDDMTTVGLRVERRVDRLEAWARQFDGVRVHKSVQAGGPLVEMRGPMVEMRALDIKPLDHLEPKG